MNSLSKSLLSLITETATNLPADVRKVLARASQRERLGITVVSSTQYH